MAGQTEVGFCLPAADRVLEWSPASLHRGETRPCLKARSGSQPSLHFEFDFGKYSVTSSEGQTHLDYKGYIGRTEVLTYWTFLVLRPLGRRLKRRGLASEVFYLILPPRLEIVYYSGVPEEYPVNPFWEWRSPFYEPTSMSTFVL